MDGGYIGRSVPRVEDSRLVSGEGQYTADIKMPGLLDAAFVRSEVAHGRIRSVDAGPARRVPGVVGAYGAADLPDLPAVPPSTPRESNAGRDWPALATDKVRHVGQTVAVVVAEDRYAAEDGADAVEVDIEPLPAIVDPTEAAAEAAVELFEGSNVVSDRSAGEPIDEGVWEEAAVVVEAFYREQLLAPTSIEGRAFLARPEPDGGLTVWCSHQSPHSLRAGLAEAFDLPLERVHVVVPDVGGAFGAKSQTFPEYIAVAFLARMLDRPVRWVEDRNEALVGATHGRGQNQKVRLAADEEGRMLALEVEIDADIGGYPHTGDIVPGITIRMVQGAYEIPQVYARARSVLTNTTPTAPYRGAGRPEAAYAIERTVDLLARRLGMDPAEVRRRNFIAPNDFPYETQTNRVYDSGDYPTALDKALKAINYEGWRSEQSRRRNDEEDAPLLGIGISSYVERSGGVPGSKEYGSVEALPDGTFVARSGSSSTGQGHETTFAQVVASALGVEIGAVRVIEADTREVPEGIGSFASRSMQVGGSALYRAAQGLVEEARRRMADRQGVTIDEVGYESGTLTAGPESLSFAELVAEGGTLRVDENFGPPQAFPFGCYVAIVEVDPELGDVRVLRLVAVDDYGVVINPMVVEGQGYGSVAQGLGQALYEEVPYERAGQPLVGSLLEYLLPTISEMPEKITFEETQTPNPNVPLGAKGAGESGCIGSPPAIVNAVVDALDLDGPGALQMPLTPQRCWAALQNR